MTSFVGMMRKDLQLFFRDRRAVVMSFAAPILIASFFGYVFGGNGSRQDMGQVKVLVTDSDGGPVAADVIRQLTADKTLEVTAKTADEARALVRTGKAAVALVFPEKFSTQAVAALFGTAGKPKVGVLFDPSRQTEAAMVRGVLAGAVMQSVSKEAFSGAGGRSFVKQAMEALPGATGMDEGRKKMLVDLLGSVDRFNRSSDGDAKNGGGAGGLQMAFETADEALTAGTGVVYNSYAHSFGGMTIQFMLFMGIDVGIGLLLLRQRGLWKRMRAAPLSKLTLLGSRAASAMVIGMLILLVVFSFARVVFGVRVEGSFAGLVGVCAAFSLMTATYGLLIAALGKTPEAARGLSILATLLLVMLSGAWVPSFVFPRWLQSATVVLPTRWAMDGLDGMIWRGLPFSEAVYPVLVLLGSSVVFGALALWRFRWEEQ